MKYFHSFQTFYFIEWEDSWIWENDLNCPELIRSYRKDDRKKKEQRKEQQQEQQQKQKQDSAFLNNII